MPLSAGDVIKMARKRKGMTQAELGNLLEVGKSAIQKYENGYVKNLKLDTIRKLHHHLDIMPWMLVFPEKIKTDDMTIIFSATHCSFDVFYELNVEGQKKLVEYASDLSLIDKYRRHEK